MKSTCKINFYSSINQFHVPIFVCDQYHTAKTAPKKLWHMRINLSLWEVVSKKNSKFAPHITLTTITGK